MSTQKNWLFQVALKLKTELKETCALCLFVLLLPQVFLPQQMPYQYMHCLLFSTQKEKENFWS